MPTETVNKTEEARNKKAAARFIAETQNTLEEQGIIATTDEIISVLQEIVQEEATEETVKEPLIDLHITEDKKVSHFKVIKKFRDAANPPYVLYHYELYMNDRLVDEYYGNNHDSYGTEIDKGFEKIKEVRGKIAIAQMDIKRSKEKIEEAKKALAHYLPEALEAMKG